MGGNLNVYAINTYAHLFVLLKKKSKRATNVKLYRNPFKSSFER